MGKTDLLENLMQVAPLKLIVHKSAEALGEEVNAALVEARKKINKPIPPFSKPSFVIIRALFPILTIFLSSTINLHFILHL